MIKRLFTLTFPLLLLASVSMPHTGRADDLSHLEKTLDQLEDARTELQKVSADRAGRRNKAIIHINRAILQVQAAIKTENYKKSRK